MMKFAVTIFVLLTFFLTENLALDAENYIAYIEDLSHDEKFLEEYTKWSSKLFSQRGYLYGDSHTKFPCSIDESNNSNSIPTSVHTLRLRDIKCIGAIGDSFTTGLGAHAITPVDLLFEDRGISWSVGGDYTYSQIPTIANALRQYNPKLKGFSTKGYVMAHNRQHITNSRLNVAKSGDRSNNMVNQADALIHRLNDETFCDLEDDWKMITLFAGGNDLCSFCENSNTTKHTPEQYMNSIRDTLDKLYNASVPRMLVNLVLAPDIRGIKDLNNDNYICHTLLKKICPCAASPTAEQAKTLDDYIPQYHQALFKLIDSGRYEERNDFTVVIQPFMTKTKLPYKDNDKIDFSYFAPDCFHFSGKGHSQAAISLWNNMLEPVGDKRESWHMNESLKCPTKDYPYIFTSKNSAKALDELKLTDKIETTTIISTNSISSLASTVSNVSSNFTSGVNATINYTSTVSSSSTSSSTVTADFDTTTIGTSTDSSSSVSTADVNTTSRHRRKHKKTDPNSSFNKMKFFVITGFLFIIVMILIISIIRRRKHRIYHPDSQRTDYQYFNDEIDEDEIEVYSQPNKKSSNFNNNDITKSHGARLSLE